MIFFLRVIEASSKVFQGLRPQLKGVLEQCLAGIESESLDDQTIGNIQALNSLVRDTCSADEYNKFKTFHDKYYSGSKKVSNDIDFMDHEHVKEALQAPAELPDELVCAFDEGVLRCLESNIRSTLAWILASRAPVGNINLNELLNLYLVKAFVPIYFGPEDKLALFKLESFYCDLGIIVTLEDPVRSLIPGKYGNYYFLSFFDALVFDKGHLSINERLIPVIEGLQSISQLDFIQHLSRFIPREKLKLSDPDNMQAFRRRLAKVETDEYTNYLDAETLAVFTACKERGELIPASLEVYKRVHGLLKSLDELGKCLVTLCTKIDCTTANALKSTNPDQAGMRYLSLGMEKDIDYNFLTDAAILSEDARVRDMLRSDLQGELCKGKYAECALMLMAAWVGDLEEEEVPKIVIAKLNKARVRYAIELAREVSNLVAVRDKPTQEALVRWMLAVGGRSIYYRLEDINTDAFLLGKLGFNDFLVETIFHVKNRLTTLPTANLLELAWAEIFSGRGEVFGVGIPPLHAKADAKDVKVEGGESKPIVPIVTEPSNLNSSSDSNSSSNSNSNSNSYSNSSTTPSSSSSPSPSSSSSSSPSPSSSSSSSSSPSSSSSSSPSSSSSSSPSPSPSSSSSPSSGSSPSDNAPSSTPAESSGGGRPSAPYLLLLMLLLVIQ